MKLPTDLVRGDGDLGSTLWQAAIIIAAVGIFAQTIGFGWVYDDQMEIVLNPLVRSFRFLPDIFSTTAWAGSGMETFLYRPLTISTYALNHLVSGSQPWGFHLFNVLLHAGVSVLVFRVGRAWGLSLLAAGLGGLLFAVHPVHVEVAAAVYGRKDLLAGFFTLAMILTHRGAMAKGGWRAVLPAGAFLMALLSKEIGVVALPLVVAQDWFLSENRGEFLRSSRRPKLYASYLVVLVGYLVVRNGVTGGVGIPDTYYMDNPLVVASSGSRLITAIIVIGKGLALQVIPLRLSPDYSFNAIPLATSLMDWRFLATLAFGAAAVGALFYPSVRRSILPLAIVWYLVAVFPTSNILIPVGTIFGERLLYLPGVAVCLLAGSWMGRTFRDHRWVGTALTVLVLTLLSLQTLRYSAAWQSDMSLFQWATASVPESTKAHHKLGEEYLRAGEFGNGIRSLRRALEIAPDNEFAAVTMAAARAMVAERFLREHGSSEKSTTPPPDPEVLYLLGQISRERGDLAEAGRFWEEAISLDPGHAESLGDLGVLSLMTGDSAAAFRLLTEAVSADSTLASAWFNLAKIHGDRGEPAMAAEALRRFIEGAGTGYPEQVDWAKETLRASAGS